MNELKKHKHCEIIKKWAEGYEIEYFSEDLNKWMDSIYPMFSHFMEYRLKSQPRLRPFTFEEFLKHKDRWLKAKEHQTYYKVIYVSNEGITRENLFDIDISINSEIIGISNIFLLTGYTFENGEPCGVEINGSV